MISVAAERNKVDLVEQPYLIKEHYLCKYTFDKGDYSVEFTDMDCRFQSPYSAYSWGGNVFTRKAIGYYEQEEPKHVRHKGKRSFTDCYELLNGAYRNEPNLANSARQKEIAKTKRE